MPREQVYNRTMVILAGCRDGTGLGGYTAPRKAWPRSFN
jgi:hypothetical protein